MSKPYDIKDPNLAAEGMARIEWAEREMPVLRLIRERFSKETPLQGLRVAACLHVTSETANLMRTLQAGGAEVALCASNPLSTQDDVAAALVREFEMPVYAIKGEDNETYYRHITGVLDHKPQLTMDDGADVVSILHKSRRELLPGVIGGTEETTTGVFACAPCRKRASSNTPSSPSTMPIPSISSITATAPDRAPSTAVIRATNLLLAGKTCVVAGYGWCSRGIAMRARGMGANVIITEINPLRALEAIMDGYRVMPMIEAASVGDHLCHAPPATSTSWTGNTWRS